VRRSGAGYVYRQLQRRLRHDIFDALLVTIEMGGINPVLQATQHLGRRSPRRLVLLVKPFLYRSQPTKLIGSEPRRFWQDGYRSTARRSTGGSFATPEEASEAYKRLAIQHFGEFARWK
jgi:hypothetical protein